MHTLFYLFTFSLTLLAVSGFEFCKKTRLRTCTDYCCGNSSKEYCCDDCRQSVRIEEYPIDKCTMHNSNNNTMTSEGEPSWWEMNLWFRDLLILIGILVAFFVIGGIIILVLNCTGKINLKRVFGLTRRPQPERVAANLPHSNTQSTGGSYPMQPASAAYPIKSPSYSTPVSGSYPNQQPNAGNSYPPMSANPNYPPVAMETASPSEQANK